jgi:hypothetical protein
MNPHEMGNEIDQMRFVEAVCPRPAKRGEGKGEGSVFSAGPLSRRAFGSSASPPVGGEAKIYIDVHTIRGDPSAPTLSPRLPPRGEGER